MAVGTSQTFMADAQRLGMSQQDITAMINQIDRLFKADRGKVPYNYNGTNRIVEYLKLQDGNIELVHIT